MTVKEIIKRANLILDLKCVSTKRQLENGTLIFNDKVLKRQYGIYKTGYVRRLVKNANMMYPINNKMRGLPTTWGYNFDMVLYPDDYDSMWLLLELHIAKLRKSEERKAIKLLSGY